MPRDLNPLPLKNTRHDKLLPIVSFLIPTLNAGKYLRRCLESIFSQDYPADRIEVLVADGGSTDNTVGITKDFPVKLLSNPRVIAEDGKYIAYKESTGDIIALVDADNVIASRDWLRRLVAPLVENSDVQFVESNYLVAKDFSSANTYVSLLVIADPIARMIASKPVAVDKRGEYVIRTFRQGSAPVAGANGFLWRRSVLQQYLTDTKQLNETNVLWHIARQQSIKIANVPGVGIYHYYCVSFKDFIKKRNKIAHKFMRRHLSQPTWVESRGTMAVIAATAYSFSLVGPAIEAVFRMVSQKNAAWLWHPIGSFVTASIYSVSYVREKLNVPKSV